MQAGKKNLQSSRLPRISKTSGSIRGILPTQEYRVMKVGIARMGIYPWGFIRGRELQRQWAHRVSGIYRRVSSGSSGGSGEHLK